MRASHVVRTIAVIGCAVLGVAEPSAAAPSTNSKLGLRAEPVVAAAPAASVDVTGDGLVDRTDLRAVRRRIGATCGRRRYDEAADVNGDCRIDRRDLVLVRRALGTSVNGAPVAVPDTAELLEDGAASIAVLANDTDPNGDTLAVAGVTQGAKGTVTIGEGGVLRYVPGSNANGGDVFTYTVADGKGGTSTGTVSVTIAAVNDAPTVQVSSDVSNGRAPLAVAFSAVAADVDGDVLTFAWDFGDGSSAASRAPSHVFERAGTFNVSVRVSDGRASADAAIAIEVAAPGPLTYTAATLAGTGTPGELKDDGPAASAELTWPRQVVARPDGVLFVVDEGRLLQIDTAGRLSVVRRHAGGYRTPTIAAGVDGTLYYLESDVVGTCGEEGQYSTLRVRLLAPDASDPIVAVVQRTEGLLGTCALTASLAVASDGGFYVSSPTTLFRIAPGSAVPAWELPAPGSAIRALAPRADAGVIVSGSRFLHAVSSAGVAALVAGSGNYGFAGDDGPAALADLASASGAAYDAVGTLVFVDFDFITLTPRLRSVDASGNVRTIGGGQWGFGGDGEAAINAAFAFLDAAGLAVLPDGRVIVADVENHRIRALVPTR